MTDRPIQEGFLSAPIRCFLLERTGRVRRTVRREEATEAPCEVTGGAHRRDVVLGVEPADGPPDEAPLTDRGADASQAATSCTCGRPFTAAATVTVVGVPLWRLPGGEEVCQTEAPIGAMWQVDWMGNDYNAPDGAYLFVRAPGADWSPDSPAANCTMPDDHFQQQHHCWVRTGTPPAITVESTLGPTCEAGNGSLGSPIWHGLLRDGWLITKPVVGPDMTEEEAAALRAAEEPVFRDPPPGVTRVTVWGENIHDTRNAQTRAIYPDTGMHGEIAEAIREQAPEGSVVVRTATLDQPSHGLTPEILATTDVLTWWGHVGHDRVDDAIAEAVVDRVIHDGMGLVVLHSGHYSKPFRRLMGTSCSLRWRESDDRELVWTVDPGHPVAAGIPQGFAIPAQEMYGEFFDIPTPDDLVFLSTFTGGEVFRSGCGWRRGKGRVFYFSPGHETYPVYHQFEVRRIVANAVRWAHTHDVPAVETRRAPMAPIGWWQEPPVFRVP